jgi:hypothetical protein
MVPMIGGPRPPRYPIDDIVKKTACTLLVPYDRGSRKKEVGTGVAIPPHEITDYASDQIPADYAVVIVSWVVPGFEEHDLETPTPNGVRFLGASICFEVLWNKEDILLELPTLVSQPLERLFTP